MNVLVIDSGYGGLPLLNVLTNKYRENNYIYIADTRNFPYGTKSEKILKDNVSRIKNKIQNIDEIFFACNTLSALYINDIGCKGVIRPVINEVKRKKYKKIILFATKSTIKSKIYQKNLVDKSISLTAVPQTKLINDIEKNKNFNHYFDKIIKDIDENYDCLILGCTHFLLIKEIFRDKLNIDVICADELI